ITQQVLILIIISCPSSVMTSTDEILWLLISLRTSPLVLPSLLQQSLLYDAVLKITKVSDC
ncbi:hypothetical protein L9F63_007783, partial [Diploptera punctata]